MHNNEIVCCILLTQKVRIILSYLQELAMATALCDVCKGELKPFLGVINLGSYLASFFVRMSFCRQTKRNDSDYVMLTSHTTNFP